MKPVSRDRLEKALERARALRGRTLDVAESLVRLNQIADPTTRRYSRKIVGRAGLEYHVLNIDDVLAFQAEREIVWIVTAGASWPHRPCAPSSPGSRARFSSGFAAAPWSTRTTSAR